MMKPAAARMAAAPIKIPARTGLAPLILPSVQIIWTTVASGWHRQLCRGQGSECLPAVISKRVNLCSRPVMLSYPSLISICIREVEGNFRFFGMNTHGMEEV